MEDRGNMGFNGDETFVIAGLEVIKNGGDIGLAFSGENVFRFFSIGFGVPAVFDMDMDNVIDDILIELPGVLPWIYGTFPPSGFSLRAVALEDGVSCIENEL